MTQFLPGMESEARDLSKSQWYTDPKLAAAVWQWANRYEQPKSVLEPACGRGALLRPVYEHPNACRDVLAVDLDAGNAAQAWALAQKIEPQHMVTQVRHGDFLALYHGVSGGWFDLALMNPPYEDGQAEAFVIHALTFSKRVVGIFKASILFGDERYRTLWAHAMTTREVRLATRPSFGIGASGSKGGMTDFVVLEIVRRPPHEQAARERGVLVETWP